ncbi:hypothetical protein [Thiomonas sp.]
MYPYDLTTTTVRDLRKKAGPIALRMMDTQRRAREFFYMNPQDVALQQIVDLHALILWPLAPHPLCVMFEPFQHKGKSLTNSIDAWAMALSREANEFNGMVPVEQWGFLQVVARGDQAFAADWVGMDGRLNNPAWYPASVTDPLSIKIREALDICELDRIPGWNASWGALLDGLFPRKKPLPLVPLLVASASATPAPWVF